MLDERKLRVLKAIVTDYVDYEEPVGSKALVERHNLGVSSATIRNDMAVLEEEGYITQPHTSAGRVPTDKGYRLFVDKLATVKPLSLAERRAIELFMCEAVDLDDIVSRTVRLLSQITHQVAMVQYPVAHSATIRRVEVVSLSTERALVILIHSSGVLEQRFLDLPEHSQEELDSLLAPLNETLNGKTTSTAKTDLDDLAENTPEETKPIMDPVIEALKDLLDSVPLTKVVVAGVPNISNFGTDFEANVQPILEALEEQVVLMKLVGEIARAAEGEVTVRIGEENPYQKLRSTSLVGSAYSSSSDTSAGLGVVGPTRMDYPSTMAAVRAVARYVSRFLAEG